MRLRMLIALLMFVAACGGDEATPSTDPPASTTSSTSPSTTATTTTVTTITEGPATTTTATTTTIPTTPTLENGLPATFVAVTDEYVAVEIDTATGEIAHVFGQTGTPEEMASAEEIAPNVLVGAWRNRDGSIIGLSDCCEPAAGRLFYLEPGGSLGSDPYGESQPWNTGWAISPSPADNRFAIIGYSLGILDPDNPTAESPSPWLDNESLGFPTGAAAWTRDGSQIYWSTQLQEVTALATFELTGEEPSHVTVLPWVGVHQFLDGLGTQANGNLVGFLHTGEGPGASETISTEGVVFSTAGEVLANFPVETGSLWGGYDPSGTFLIYVDGDGTVRWQGAGQSGALAEGFIFASW